MTTPPLKQKKIKLLYEAGLSLSEIAKKTRVTYKTAKKYSGMSTTLQPQSPAPQQPVIDGCSPKFEPTKTKRVRDTTRSYADYENKPYNRPASVAPPSCRGLVNVTDAKPLVTTKPLTKMQKELKELENRKGLDVSWVPKENARREALRQRIQRDAMEEIRKREHDKKISQHINDIQSIIIEKNRKKNCEILNNPIDQSITREGIQNAIREVVQAYKAKQKRKIIAFRGLKELQNNEIYRLKKKKTNEKFVGDVVQSASGFLDDIVKSVIMLNSKPKIVKAQLIKKPMKARVIE